MPLPILKRALSRAGIVVALTMGAFATAEELATAAAGDTGDTHPKPFPVSRYRTLIDKSPFMRTSAAVIAPPEVSFAEDFSLVSVARIDGQYFVGIENRKTKDYFEVGETGDSMRVVDVRPHSDPLRVKVKLAKGSEVAMIGFDEQQISAPGIQPPKGSTGRPGARPTRPPQVRTASAAPAVHSPQPALPLKPSTPRRRVVLPRNLGT